MDKFLNKREINKRIIAVVKPSSATGRANVNLEGYIVKHDILGEAIVCEVPTLEIAGCIVKALRERQLRKLAMYLLAKKHTKGRGK